MTLLLFFIPALLIVALAPAVFHERPGVRRPLGLPRSHPSRRLDDLEALSR